MLVKKNQVTRIVQNIINENIFINFLMALKITNKSQLYTRHYLSHFIFIIPMVFSRYLLHLIIY